MKIYIMTDLEGVAGVLDFENWCRPESRYYELAKEFLTREVNAAVEGFYAGGAAEIVVCDGHGHGGINPILLDPRVEFIRGLTEGYPFFLDSTFDGVAWVGQHAKAGTQYAHLAHTGTFGCLDQTINGISVGELGEFAMCAAELGVKSIFLAGDKAACKEAEELMPGIKTVSVKRGNKPGTGNELNTQEYAERNVSATHIHPERAREAVRKGAEQAIKLVTGDEFGLLKLVAPFKRTMILRSDKKNPKRISEQMHPSSVISVMNMPHKLRPAE